MNRPNVFEYQNYRFFLKDWFDYRKKSEKNFSINRLATLSGLGSSILYLVLSGKRGLGAKSLFKMGNHLNLKPSELSYLEILRNLEETKCNDARESDYKRMQKFRQFEMRDPNQLETYHYIKKWHYVAIKELAQTKGFKADPTWIQERLSSHVPLEEIIRALDYIREGMPEVVDCIGGAYRLALADFHRQMFDLAGQSFESAPRGQRKIRGYTVAFTPQQYSKACEAIETAFKTIAEIGSDSRYNEKEKIVYHATLCAFPLTKKANGND